MVEGSYRQIWGQKNIFFSKREKYYVCTLIEMTQEKVKQLMMLKIKERIVGPKSHSRVGERGCDLVQQQRMDRSKSPGSLEQEEGRGCRCRVDDGWKLVMVSC